jgi:DNA-directed RNA polymerase specialized sigma24 family protein
VVPEALHPIAAPEVEALAMHQEDLDRLRVLLRALDAEARDLLALRYAAGLTTGAIAGVIGKTEAATKKRLSRVLYRLKEQYHAAE